MIDTRGFSEKIHDDNFCLMRHLKEKPDKTFVEESVRACDANLEQLVPHILGRRVAIHHSVITRAMLTAGAVKEGLELLGVQVDGPERLVILDDKWTAEDPIVAPRLKDERFHIFVTHLNSLWHFFKTEDTVTFPNGIFIGRDFVIGNV